MLPDAAVFQLRRYLRWRKGEGPREFGEAGFTCAGVCESIEGVLAHVTVQEAEIRSLKARLARAQVQRERIHAELRKKARAGDAG